MSKLKIPFLLDGIAPPHVFSSVCRQLRSCFATCPHSLGMHARVHLEAIDNKRDEGKRPFVYFVKIMETGNIVESLMSMLNFVSVRLVFERSLAWL